MANRIVTAAVTGESIKLSNKLAGAAGSFNAVSLAFTFDGAWDGTTSKIVQFLDAYGANPVNITLTSGMLVSGAYIVPIPAEPLVYAGEMTVTVRGVDFEVDGTTAERIIVCASTTMKVLNSLYEVGGTTPVEPTPTQAEQLLAAVSSVTDMTVSAVELASGVTAYVTKTDNVDGTINLEFGLPAGPQGTQGIQGEQGIQGSQGIQGIQGVQGYRIGSVYKKSGTGAAGTTDVYGMKLNDVSETEVGTFNVYNGADGEGAGDMVAAVYDPNGKNADAFSMANMVEGTANKIFTATERTKLSGIATGATANSTDATLLNRTNHTGTQLKSTISDFSHAHGNITNDGKIGSTADLMLATTTAGEVSTKTVADTLTLLGLSSTAKIAAGSYTGTGAYGSGNPNSLTFAGEILELLISYRVDNAFASNNLGCLLPLNVAMLPNDNTYYAVDMLAYNTYKTLKIKKSVDKKTISWYSEVDAGKQCNAPVAYYYIGTII